MAIDEEIDSAVEAHCNWGESLKRAIDTGISNMSVETARDNSICKFGQWIYGDTIPQAAKDLPGYADIVKLHAEFHKRAAEVLQLALAGRKMEALDGLKITSEYATNSIMLRLSLRTWQIDAEKITDVMF